MLKHKNLRTTEHHAKVLDKKVSEDIKILRDKFVNAMQLIQKINLNYQIIKRMIKLYNVSKNQFYDN